MRRSWIAIAAGTALLAAAAATSLAAPANAAPSRATHRTVRTVVRPVTPAGHAAPGFHVEKVKGGDPVDCSSAVPSVAAVDDGILRCAPDAAGANACWRASTPHHVLCLRDARSDVLVELRTSGRVAHPKASSHPMPLELTLANGLVCTLRNGGAGTFLKQHRNWSVFYFCNHDQAVWAPLDARSAVHHHTDREWTVEVAKSNGKHDVHTVRVKHVYFVGTQG